LADFADINWFAHDARSQFMNWSLMCNAAWDYPANTRGYTYALILEASLKNFAVRGGISVVPKEANASNMNFNISKAAGTFMDAEYGWQLLGHPGKVHALAFFNYANMGNYNLATQMDTPDITATRVYSRIKYGFGINAEQYIAEHAGMFVKGSWNDGKNETWMFTEIDNSFTAGVSVNGFYWKRKNDVVALAVAVNGISKEHRNYLAKGGYGFIIGDGKLNYAPEFVTELYYSFELWKDKVFITPDYQFILNPAYNKDRGPVHALGLRAHIEF
jgi:high affinity Mn2+ porin